MFKSCACVSMVSSCGAHSVTAVTRELCLSELWVTTKSSEAFTLVLFVPHCLGSGGFMPAMGKRKRVAAAGPTLQGQREASDTSHIITRRHITHHHTSHIVHHHTSSHITSPPVPLFGLNLFLVGAVELQLCPSMLVLLCPGQSHCWGG